MGYFADTQKSELMKLIKDNENFRPIPIFPGQASAPIRTVAGRIYQDFKDATLNVDPCNITLTTRFGTFTHRNPYCQLPQVPPNDIDKLRRMDLSRCGLITFRVIYASKILGFVYDTDINGYVRQSENSSPNIILQLIKSKFPDFTGDIYDFYNSGGSSGVSEVKTAGNGSTYKIYPQIGNGCGADGDPQRYLSSYPSYYVSGMNVEIQSGTDRVSVNAILDDLSAGDFTPIIDNLYVSSPDALGCPSFTPTSDPPPPPKRKKKEKEDKDMCCPGQQNNDALLKLLIKRVGSLPASVPDNFAKQNPSYINIESLAELMLWQMQQLDALLGAFPIEIKVEDTDLTKDGDQTETISLPNVAEGLAELLGLLITTKRDTQATLITAIKAMAEAGMAKQLGVKTLDVTLANAEFLGYKLEQKEKEIPSLFTPNGQNITETLKEKNIKIVTYENTDKNDLQDDLKILKTMAARWNAQNWRSLTGDIVEDLKQKLLGNPDAISANHKENEQGSFNDFTEQAERGFIEVSGITDTINPWGRPYDQRPKIREIGTEKGNYDNDGREIVR
ncbi:hypothetical protein [Nostoc sp. TCL240-02]|uniref:hypothetical protein n=1 Tax=Nostoc sp. TCL240-02 TaxID=2572090 RepID=UPI00157FB4C1|nr:hypothetical protein [Nostoc sp. TCL240-02]QKQ76454.1 hypothetical protein FBB35_27000 [Nostoc sp. TCL240-02]